MQFNNSTFKPTLFVYRTKLYRSTVDAALKSGWFKGKRSYANMLSQVSKFQQVDWNVGNLSSSFAWALTPVPVKVWEDVNSCCEKEC